MSLWRSAAIGFCGIASMLAGGSVVHQFFSPDLTLPPPPVELQEKLTRLREELRKFE